MRAVMSEGILKSSYIPGLKKNSSLKIGKNNYWTIVEKNIRVKLY